MHAMHATLLHMEEAGVGHKGAEVGREQGTTGRGDVLFAVRVRAPA